VRRIAILLFAAAFVVPATAAEPARAVQCTYNGVLFNWCGEHWPASKLPVTFRVDVASAPTALRAQFMDAARAAAQAWNQAWPTKSTGCAVICLIEGPATFGTADGKNGLSWVPANGACGHSSGVLATTCMRTSGSDSFGKLITEADIALNPSPPSGRTWRMAGTLQLITGELYAAWPNALCTDWYDVQSTLTHEFGHALGLEHVGNEATPYPNDLTESPYTLQTMYWAQGACTTNMRTLDAGDIAGLHAVALASSAG